MENIDIAKIFWEMAELLELSGANPFRIRAYERAAQNIEALTENIEGIYHAGKIIDIPGIGAGIAAHIKELIKTGRLKEHRQLLKKFPPTLLEMLRVPGIGPKSAALFYHKLKIKNIAQLEKAAAKGALNDLPGMGTKKIENILSGIKQFYSHQGRYTLNTAMEYADAIVSKLKTNKVVTEIMPAGSLRRMKETIGDIDLLVISKSPQKIMEAFISLPQVKKVSAKGPTRSSVILKNEMNCDLRVLEPKIFGAALHYFTGSKAHNIKIREMAVKRGLKISEYGVFKGKKLAGGKTEEEIFHSVGLPYIPPELREDRGEIEAAARGKLPTLIEQSNIRGDLHAHSTWSDGGNSIEEMAKAALKLGFAYLAITDHSKAVGIAGGLSETELIDHNKEIDCLNKQLKNFRVLKGTEVDILPDGSLDYNDALLKTCDVVIGAVHSKFNMDKAAMTERIIKAMRNPYINIIAHPTGRLLGKRSPYEVDLEAVLQAAKATGTFIELNAYPERLDLDDIHCKRAKELGVLAVINTDAHTIQQFSVLKYGIATARRGWLEAENVLNTLPLEKLLKKLFHKRT